MAKKLEARVRQNFWMGSIRAFSGMEFTKTEWRVIPEGLETAAMQNDMLEVREVSTQGQIKATPVKDAKPAPEPMKDWEPLPLVEENTSDEHIKEVVMEERKTRRARKQEGGNE